MAVVGFSHSSRHLFLLKMREFAGIIKICLNYMDAALYKDFAAMSKKMCEFRPSVDIKQ